MQGILRKTVFNIYTCLLNAKSKLKIACLKNYGSKFVYYPAILIFTFIANLNYSQIPEKDFQIWQNFEVEYQISKRWLSNFQTQFRFNENASQFSYYYIDGGLMFRITKNLRINADYIFIQKKRLDDSYSSRHQYNVYFNLRKKIGRFTFFNRLLTEGQFTDFNRSINGNQLADIYLRNKFSARYKIFQKWSLYIWDEIYYHFDGKYYESGFNRNRLSTGLIYKLTDLWLLETFYTYEDNFKARYQNQNFILGFSVTRSFYQ